MTTELLRQIRVLDPLSATDEVVDVLVVDGWIRAIAPSLDPLPDGVEMQALRITDQPGLILGPGLVDLYSHSGEPGNESRETLTSLAQAAIAGGFSRLTLLPDTQPPLDHPASIVQLQQQIQPIHPAPQIRSWGALTMALRGEQMTELGELATTPVVGFADGRPLQNPVLFQRLLEYGQGLGKPMAFWPCDRHLAAAGVAREGPTSIQLGLPGCPAIAETTALAALLECVAETDTPVHVMRVSTARSVELIRQAKQRGLPITASTTWMHLLLNVTALNSYDPSLRLDPPLGNPADQAALIQGVKDGVVEAIAIDHSPYTYEEKTVAFANAPPGAIGLELALPLLWQTLVESGQWTALDLWTALSLNPSLCLGQSPPTLVVDQPAEMVLFAPQAEWRVTPDQLKSLAHNTPWLGQSLSGRVLKTWTLFP